MKKTIALLLVLIMGIMTLLAGCGGGGAAGDGDKPMVVGYSNFSSKFSPFFAESAYDQEVANMTLVTLLDTDRAGAIVEKGKTGETREWNGTEYTYTGPADVTITENEDGSVDYDFDLRDDMTFSDGEPLTADDVIFSMYVLCDPTYDGSSTFYSIPIKGLEEYRGGMTPLVDLLLEAGPDNTDFSLWDEDAQKAFWEEAEAAGPAFAQSIVDYCIANGYNAADDPVEACAANWGFELDEGATVDDFWAALKDAYEGDLLTLSDTEQANGSLFSMMENYDSKWATGVKTGDSAANIEGIQKTGDYGVKVTLTEADAAAIYQFSLAIAPMHYYGDPEKYDYDNNQFGFDKGDLSTVRAKTTEPMGAGPYKFVKFENGVVSFEANDSFYRGAPKTKNVQFLESQDEDKLNGVITGTIDITDPSFSLKTAEAIGEANGNGEINGDVIITNTVDNLGYGYLAMNANNVSVKGEKGSEASKNLRKAFATIFALYRDVSVDSYYGDAATVINYPISNTSWAAPKPTDSDYAIAFSKDVEGNEIYTSGMTDEEREAAAAEAALGYFEAAGYTVENGKVTAAPEGAKMEYEAWIPADGSGDHPSFMMLNLSKDALAKLGISLVVKDLANSSDLWPALEAQSVDMWCAAWGATPEPDMYQVYYSGVESGKEAGGSNYMYEIADPELDKLILEARSSMDQNYRKTVYKSCLDIIVDWAVEVPVYQRQNAIIYSPERVNADTMTPDISTYYNWWREIENIEMN